MRPTRLWLLTVIALSGGTLAAQTQKVVNIQNDKEVKRITFDREQVTIIYADGTQEQGVQQATIRRSDNGAATGVQSISGASQPIGRIIYDLQGRRVNTRSALPKGVYIEVEGNNVRKTIIK